MSMKKEAISPWKQQGSFIVDLRQFNIDFRVLLSDLGWPNDQARIRVDVRSYEDFAAWAQKQEPDWDRYRWDGVDELVKRGLLPRHVLDRYDQRIPQLDALKAQGIDVYEVGFDRYVDSLARSIKDGKVVPPLVAVDGSPVDGRHRALAALRLDRKTAPVIDLVYGVVD